MLVHAYMLTCHSPAKEVTYIARLKVASGKCALERLLARMRP
jgi:hypothetical protein